MSEPWWHETDGRPASGDAYGTRPGTRGGERSTPARQDRAPSAGRDRSDARDRSFARERQQAGDRRDGPDRRNAAGPATGRSRPSAWVSAPGRDPAPGQRPRWGALPTGRGIVLVAGAAAVGVAATVVTGSEPGALLGICVIIGAAAAVLAVRPTTAYQIIPAPALAYVVAAAVAGSIHDRATDTTRTGLAVGLAQWIAGGFLAMSAATILVIVVAAVRWIWSRYRSGDPGRGQPQLQGPRPGQPRPGQPRPGQPRPGQPDDAGPGRGQSGRFDAVSGSGPAAPPAARPGRPAGAGRPAVSEAGYRTASAYPTWRGDDYGDAPSC